MVSGSWARYAPLSGLLFVALLVVSIIVSGFDSVDSNDSVVKVVEFWKDNDTEQSISRAPRGGRGRAFPVVPRLAAECIPGSRGRDRKAFVDRLRRWHRARGLRPRGRRSSVRDCRECGRHPARGDADAFGAVQQLLLRVPGRARHALARKLARDPADQGAAGLARLGRRSCSASSRSRPTGFFASSSCWCGSRSSA